MRASRRTTGTPAAATIRRHLPTVTVRTAVVCLPAQVPSRALAQRATAVVATHGLPVAGVLPHFHTCTIRTGKLADRWHGTTSGGPIKLLDLDGMRAAAAADAATRWLVWDQVVTGTKQAQSFWFFADRHHADPARYPLPRAQADYLAQPRILAMTAHNAVPGQRWTLPTSALEAFQAGHTTYVNLAWLAAVPADALAPAGGGWLTTRSHRLADQLHYLRAANAHLAALASDTHLVAVASPIPA
jgi:hypothetical protein